MSQILNLGKELLRINHDRNRIEFSTNGGRSWIARFSGANAGTFIDLSLNGEQILANTSKGLYVSNNSGRSWIKRG